MVLVAKSNTVVRSAKECTGKNTNPTAKNQVQHLLLLQHRVYNVKSNVFVFPASVGQCSTAVQSARDWTGHFTKTSVPAHGVLGAKFQAMKISTSISSTEKKKQDTEGIEEGAIKPPESSAMHESTNSLDAIQQHTSSITEICSYCKKEHFAMKKCDGCGKVQYYGKECQRVHWKEHKSNCKESSTAPTTTPTSCAQCKKQCICVPGSCGLVFYCSTEWKILDWLLHKDKCTSTPSAGSKNTSNGTILGSISSTEKNPKIQKVLKKVLLSHKNLQLCMEVQTHWTLYNSTRHQ